MCGNDVIIYAHYCGKLLRHALKIPAISRELCDNMADNLANGAALRQTLVGCLTDILSPEHHVRSSAEERLKLLEVTEGKINICFLCVNGALQNYLFKIILVSKRLNHVLLTTLYI